MNIDLIPYQALLHAENTEVLRQLEHALLNKGIVGISGVPEFEQKSRRYVDAVRAFGALSSAVKEKYAPNRDAGETEGYELGAEWFQDANGHWQIDDRKASFYAFVPDNDRNKWPEEIDLKHSYLALGELIFQTGKLLLNAIHLNETVGLHHQDLVGYGRMLHYFKEGDIASTNPNWCGAHLDHGVFTGLLPAYYFRDNEEIEEPAEAGLFIMPTNGNAFEKIEANDKSILLFQVGEFAQLLSNDKIRATKHKVKKADKDIERITFALFYSASDETCVNSTSILTSDSRYTHNQLSNGSVSYEKWQEASYARYRAKVNDSNI